MSLIDRVRMKMTKEILVLEAFGKLITSTVAIKYRFDGKDYYTEFDGIEIRKIMADRAAGWRKELESYDFRG